MRYLILIIFLLAQVGFSERLAVAAATESVPKVVVAKRTIVIVRRGKFARDFPDRKRAVINYPVILGPRNSEILRKVRAKLEIKNVFNISVAEYKADTWLSEFTYEVNYNKNFIFDIAFTQSGVAAYPSDQTKHIVINLRNGDLLRAADIFKPDTLSTLAALVDKKLQAEIQETIQQVPEAREDSEQLYGKLKFNPSNLDDFSVSDKGITFLYDANFPHVVQALAPNGVYFFSYAELKPFIKPDGPLGIFIR